jgi:hypothetical protein
MSGGNTVRIHYRFFNNSQLTPSGHLSGLLDGWKHGDELTLAYEGILDTELALPSSQAEELFRIFNVPGRDPAGYRGPSMSVGDVIHLVDGDAAFAVERFGFKPAEIKGAPMGVRNPKWGKYSDFSA